jgi:hypothetical protein
MRDRLRLSFIINDATVQLHRLFVNIKTLYTPSIVKAIAKNTLQLYFVHV